MENRYNIIIINTGSITILLDSFILYISDIHSSSYVQAKGKFMLLAHIYVLYEIKSLFTNKFLALADFFFKSANNFGNSYETMSFGRAKIINSLTNG